MLVSSIMMIDMGKESDIIKMEIFLKELMLMIIDKVSERCYIKMETYMKVNGKIQKDMEKVFLNFLTLVKLKEVGKMMFFKNLKVKILLIEYFLFTIYIN